MGQNLDIIKQNLNHGILIFESVTYQDIEIIFNNGFTNYQTVKKVSITQSNLLDLQVIRQKKFPELTQLIFTKNRIENIEGLITVKCNKMQILGLGKNQLHDISALQYTNFPNLTELWLNQNKILSLQILPKTNFSGLLILDLRMNNINNIEALCNCQYFFLQLLDLRNNKISDCNPFQRCKFSSLQFLYLQFLIKIYGPKLLEISIGQNQIFDFKILYKNIQKNPIINGFQTNLILEEILTNFIKLKIYEIQLDEQIPYIKSNRRRQILLG